MIEKPTRGTMNVSDVLDRVMDKGIVINAETSFQLVGMVLSEKGARLIVSSIETHLDYADILSDRAPTSWHPFEADGGTRSGPAGRSRIGRYLSRAVTERNIQ